MHFGPADNKISFSHSHFALTQRGVQIAGAVFSSGEMTLANDLQESYIREIVSVGRQNPFPLTIMPKIGDKFAPFAAEVDNKPNATLPLQTNFEIPREKELSDRVRRLIRWANERYLVSFRPNPSRENQL
jgi:hypothetical protein